MSKILKLFFLAWALLAMAEEADIPENSGSANVLFPPTSKLVLKQFYDTPVPTNEFMGQYSSFFQNGHFPSLDSETYYLPKKKRKKVRDKMRDYNVKDAVDAITDPPDVGECNPTELDKSHDRTEVSFTPRRDYLGPFKADRDDDITNQPEAGCGYKLKGFSHDDIENMCVGMKNVAEGKVSTCHPSNCTTASFVSVIKIMRQRDDWDERKSQFTCRPPQGFGSAYITYRGADGLRKMVKEFGLGKSKRISPKDFEKQDKLDWPKAGDPVLLQRTPPYNNSGHAVIFDHYQKDSAGKITHICYWSSNSSTGGTGERCESVHKMAFIDAARIDND